MRGVWSPHTLPSLIGGADLGDSTSMSWRICPESVVS